MVNHDLLWGTSGIDGTSPLVWKKLGELTSDHLQNILLCCGHHIPDNYKMTIYDILIERGIKPIYDVTKEESEVIYNAYMTKRAILLRNQ